MGMLGNCESDRKELGKALRASADVRFYGFYEVPCEALVIHNECCGGLNADVCMIYGTSEVQGSTGSKVVISVEFSK